MRKVVYKLEGCDKGFINWKVFTMEDLLLYIIKKEEG